MSFLDDEILLNQLVEETLEGKTDPIEMISYQLHYYDSVQCYQLEVGEKIYTFPVNWGPFAEVHKREGEGIVLENDQDSFNSVFGSLVGSDVKTAFLYEGQDTYIVFVPKKMEINISDLHSLVCNQSDFKIAA